MSEILITGLTLPKKGEKVTIELFSDGVWCDYNNNNYHGKAIEVPTHGDLIDRQKLLEHRFEVYDSNEEVCEDYIETYHVLEALAIIEASKERE